MELLEIHSGAEGDGKQEEYKKFVLMCLKESINDNNRQEALAEMQRLMSSSVDNVVENQRAKGTFILAQLKRVAEGEGCG